MNNEQKIKAKDLYFQTNLTKTQIAESLQISRTALYNWIKTENWERLKFSAEHIPAVLAENCYHILGTLTEHHLSMHTLGQPIKQQEVDTMYKLVRTIERLKNRTTINENMETFTLFLDNLKKQNPKLADEVVPYIDSFLTYRAGIYRQSVVPETFNGLNRIEEKERNHEEERRDGIDDYNLQPHVQKMGMQIGYE